LLPDDDAGTVTVSELKREIEDEFGVSMRYAELIIDSDGEAVFHFPTHRGYNDQKVPYFDATEQEKVTKSLAASNVTVSFPTAATDRATDPGTPPELLVALKDAFIDPRLARYVGGGEIEIVVSATPPNDDGSAIYPSPPSMSIVEAIYQKHGVRVVEVDDAENVADSEDEGDGDLAGFVVPDEDEPDPEALEAAGSSAEEEEDEVTSLLDNARSFGAPDPFSTRAPRASRLRAQERIVSAMQELGSDDDANMSVDEAYELSDSE